MKDPGQSTLNEALLCYELWNENKKCLAPNYKRNMLYPNIIQYATIR